MIVSSNHVEPAQRSADRTAIDRTEGIFFHRALFGTDPSDQFLRLYLKAHDDLAELTGEPAEAATVEKVLRHRLNPLAVEAALRNKGQRHLLTRKLLLVCYIAECDDAHLRDFTSKGPAWRFWMGLPFWGVRSIGTILWGRFLVGFHEMV